MSVQPLDALSTGWIGFGPIHGYAGLLVGAGEILTAPVDSRPETRHRWRVRHCGTVVQDSTGLWLYQAEPHGFERVPLTPMTHWTSEWTYVLPAYPKPNQAELVGRLAQRMAAVRTPYGFEDYAAIAAHRVRIPVPHLDHFIAATNEVGLPKRAICSQAVDAQLSVSGGLDGRGHVFDDGRLAQDVTPAELFIQLTERLTPAAVIVP